LTGVEVSGSWFIDQEEPKTGDLVDTLVKAVAAVLLRLL
jgi:hypothetical protein